MYPRYYNYPPQNREFIIPFLLGGIAGAGAVGLTRPRPIYNVAPYYPYYPNNAKMYYY